MQNVLLHYYFFIGKINHILCDIHIQYCIHFFIFLQQINCQYRIFHFLSCATNTTKKPKAFTLQKYEV